MNSCLAYMSLWIGLALSICVAVVFATTSHDVSAQERAYHYERIALDIAVQEDTTFDVKEAQTYRFVGSYNQGWRSIPYTKFDAITDIRVIDASSGEVLRHSSKRLEKTDPASWGAYTYFKEDGSMNIE